MFRGTINIYSRSVPKRSRIENSGTNIYKGKLELSEQESVGHVRCWKKGERKAKEKSDRLPEKRLRTEERIGGARHEWRLKRSSDSYERRKKAERKEEGRKGKRKCWEEGKTNERRICISYQAEKGRRRK